MQIVVLSGVFYATAMQRHDYQAPNAAFLPHLGKEKIGSEDEEGSQ